MLKSLMLAAVAVIGLAGYSVAQDAAAGETVFKKCKTCHMVGEGAANRVGPELNGIVGRAIASIDFNYSNAMKEFAAANGAWTVELLDAYLAAPKTVVPSGKMAFAGLPDAADRANVIAYLQQFAATPPAQ